MVNFELFGGPRIYKPLGIIIAPLTVWFGLCRLFRVSGELWIAIINHSLKRFPVVNCGSVTGGDFPPIPGSNPTAQGNEWTVRQVKENDTRNCCHGRPQGGWGGKVGGCPPGKFKKCFH